jgi:HNH endonuclease
MHRPVLGPWEARFWSKVETDGHQPGGCWLWRAALAGRYGHFTNNKGKTVWAHRVAYELARGPISKGLTVDHLCENPACVNAEHMQLLTASENLARRHRLHRKTECAHGHPLTAETTYEDGRCRQCSRNDALRRYHRAKGNSLALD